MELEQEMNMQNVYVQKINDKIFVDKNITVEILRLDKIHSIVSGNKWFKLKYYLQDAIENKYNSIATLGGAYSNHILATAYACNKANLECIGFIRGEEPKQYSQTLLDAQSLNMRLRFLSRSEYAQKQAIKNADHSVYFIPEGGYGITGAKGAAEIMALVTDLSKYDYIVCAAGTGTMLAGITNATMPHQQCIGISVMKNNFSLENEILSLVDDTSENRVRLLHNYDFGGYAKYSQELIDFMNNIWTTNLLPLDFVYTAKALYAVFHLTEKNYFGKGSNILFIHSGGLQGNRSLSKETLGVYINIY